MKRIHVHGRGIAGGAAVWSLAAAALLVIPCTGGPMRGAASDPCANTAKDALKSCKHEQKADYWISVGKCEDILDPVARADCKHQAKVAMKENLKDCKDQYEKRREVCDDLGGGVYDPQVDPASFVAVIDNTYMPLIPGTLFVFEGRTADGFLHREMQVTHATKAILGVTCTVVHDASFIDGNLQEDTLDWFAQDTAGNVWYFGESTQVYEDGVIESIEGSWMAGVDDAKPGIVMPGAPVLNQLYREEYLLGTAEDVARLVATGETVSVPYGTLTNCLRTENFTALEPDALENKTYAPGIGSVLEVDLDTGESEALIDVQFH